MATTMAFQRAAEGFEDEARWISASDPPFVVAYGGDDFIQLPDEMGLCGYVNGVRVVGCFQAILPGDFVRIERHGREPVAFRFAGRRPDGAEPGRGRPCAFTRMPIEGDSVACGGCGRIVSVRVAEQIGMCACGRPLRQDRGTPPPAEELL